MNTTILARSPPAGFFLCPKSSNKQGEEPMNDIFENTETMKENEHPHFHTAESVMRGSVKTFSADTWKLHIFYILS